ncbi:hypothetical protein HMPREF1214_02029 [Bacteroides sp. HPS0048]|uniref:hypothetical protein n=1 Tax=Bacteroides sp. HPS0048 TaxID=1078089 RepID=UPI00036582DC|nr:hypothetical protein [Bacteroides sp. HPS0048]EOA58457.1 hypothetical protein HMPREF1214_02029 [Bacteroides sp. HPS0048]
MARYKVKTRFVFEGTFSVEADSRQEAKKIVLESCGLVMGSNIHTDLDDEEVDWDFDTHPTKEIGRVVIDRQCRR